MSRICFVFSNWYGLSQIILLTFKPPKNGLIALWPSTNGVIPYFLVLPGSELSITEITEYFSPLKPCREFIYKSELNIVPVDLIIEPILFLRNIIFTFCYTRVRPQCEYSILGRTGTDALSKIPHPSYMSAYEKKPHPSYMFCIVIMVMPWMVYEYFFSRPYGLPTSRSPSPLGSISCRSCFLAAAVLEGWPVIHPILYRHTYTCTYMYTQRHTYTHKHAHIISGHAHVFVNAWRNSTTLEGSVYSTHCDIAPGRASARTRTFQSTRNL